MLQKDTLSVTSTVVANDTYEIVIACNGRTPPEVELSTGKASLYWKNKSEGIAV